MNTADREMLLRVPGLGVRGVDRILAARRLKRLELSDLKRSSRSLETLKPFVVAADWSPGGLTDSVGLRAQLEPFQPDLFA